MNEQAKDFILAIGVLAETMRLLREELLKNGFTRQEAIHICTAFMIEKFRPQNNNQEEN